ncbi:MAG: decaprenyl-phosphate phosphoribosyltransferase [Candidatus Latescibacterota bacterium]
MTVGDTLQLLRIRQWTKNTLIFAALIFSSQARDVSDVVKSVEAFVLFCLITGAVYIFNDIFDVDKDRAHPVKKFRPIAAGHIGIGTSWLFFSLLSAATLVLSFLFSTGFGTVVLAYLLLQIIYTVFLKHMVILDVFVISFGFLLRVIAGALAIQVAVSNWILICTMLLALFLALSKRRHEIVLLEKQADAHRTILKNYTPYLLDQMIGVVTSATLVAYMIFTLSEETVHKFGSHLVLTVPFVLYGIFRYLYLVHSKNEGGQPEEILLSDIPLQLTILIYGVVAIAVIYF